MTSRHARQAAGGQGPQKRQPARTVLGGGDINAQDFAVALGVDPDRDQGVHVDHPSGLADFKHQGIGGHEGVGAGIQGPGAEGFHGGVEFLAITLTCDFDKLVMPRVSTSLSIRRVDTPSR